MFVKWWVDLNESLKDGEKLSVIRTSSKKSFELGSEDCVTADELLNIYNDSINHIKSYVEKLENENKELKEQNQKLNEELYNKRPILDSIQNVFDSLMREDIRKGDK